MDKKNLLWILPILLLVLLTPFISSIDLEIARYFFRKEGGHFSQDGFPGFIYTYGVIPAEITAISATVVFFLSYFFPTWKKWRPYAMLLIIPMVIGAGLIVHVMLKDRWGRPRPKQVIEFGGKQEFRPYYKPNFFHQPEPSKSFTCGHCTMGFYFFALAFAGYRLRNKTILYLGIALTLILGFTLSYARLAQGGHFFSDVFVAALIMWLTTLASDWLIFSRKRLIS